MPRFVGHAVGDLVRLSQSSGILFDQRCRAQTLRRYAGCKAFAEEQPMLRPPQLAPDRAVLKLEWRLSHDGMISFGGNAYSVPDSARRRALDVQCKQAV